MRGQKLLLLLMVVLGLRIFRFAGTGHPNPRLLVLTDISSLTAGVAEPDDGQSLIRLMLHANEFDIEGLIATSNLEHGQKTQPDLIRQVVDAYEKAHPNLLSARSSLSARRDTERSHQDWARTCWTQGASHGIGRGWQRPEASEWIIKCCDRPVVDPPLHDQHR